MQGPNAQDLFAWLALRLRRRIWFILVAVAVAIALQISVAGFSWTGLVAMVLILFFTGIALLVLAQVLTAMSGGAKPRRPGDAR